MIGTVMGCCHGHGHAPWCWYDDPRGGIVDEPSLSGGPRRRRRRFDEEALSDHLEDLEDEVRELRRLLEGLRGDREDVRP